MEKKKCQSLKNINKSKKRYECTWQQKILEQIAEDSDEDDDHADSDDDDDEDSNDDEDSDEDDDDSDY